MSVFGQNTAFQEVRIGAVAQHFKVVISLYKCQACTLKAVDELIGYAAGVGRKGGDGASLKAITDTEFRVVRRTKCLDLNAAEVESWWEALSERLVKYGVDLPQFDASDFEL